MFPLRDNIRSRSFPVVNMAFIVANVAVFLFELQLQNALMLEGFIRDWGLVPAVFFSNPAVHFPDIFSAMFLHGSWGHVISNMWFLLIFGDNVEDAMGHARYFFFYLLMGFGAAAAQMAASPGSQLPMVGASGAVAGILGAYFFLHPRAKVLTALVLFVFIRIVEIPAFFFLGLWFLTQTIAGLGTLSSQAVRGDMGGVAWWAHAGGFAAGFLGIHIFRKR